MSTALNNNRENFALIYIDIESRPTIVYKKNVLQIFKKGEFLKCLTMLICNYFVFSIPFTLQNERIIGFLLESVSFTQPFHFDKRRSSAYLKLLTQLIKN